jgi:hypothetical protein
MYSVQENEGFDFLSFFFGVLDGIVSPLGYLTCLMFGFDSQS